MSLIKWKEREMTRPGDEFRSLQEAINDLFNFDHFPVSHGLFDQSVCPSIDVVEGSGEFTVTCELPGIEQNEVDVSIASNVLTIKGEKKEKKETKDGKYYKKEIRNGSFQRTLSLPSSVNAEKIKAEMKDGMLAITLPKREEAIPKQITVNVK